MYWGKGVAESNKELKDAIELAEDQCADCRIAISTEGLEVDSSQGNLLLEAGVLGAILIFIAVLYTGKKLVDKQFKK